MQARAILEPASLLAIMTTNNKLTSRARVAHLLENFHHHRERMSTAQQRRKPDLRPKAAHLPPRANLPYPLPRRVGVCRHLRHPARNYSRQPNPPMSIRDRRVGQARETNLVWVISLDSLEAELGVCAAKILILADLAVWVLLVGERQHPASPHQEVVAEEAVGKVAVVVAENRNPSRRKKENTITKR